ncbi:SRPBCC family protein [Phenylobacterium deserti]|uniref:Polyketide cyclase n=1 Tax=Phenylobacterium deserti TaxID=1914756 RepID=A0A328A9Y9_9CAUL|nr:SRPBCC family protein [Phenylobacterium deserti]RAK51450.1 polyketide cyclase [Phenylobacterium deserti]
MSITNATFVIERVLNASPARVFAAYASLEAKSAWFKAPSDIVTLDRDFDFRVGGKERFRARWPSGMTSDFQATYHDIVENERIILVYDLFHNDEKLSVSLQTLELRPEGGRTRLIHTEQGSYFSGGMEAVKGREHGTAWHVDNLVALLEGKDARAFT